MTQVCHLSYLEAWGKRAAISKPMADYIIHSRLIWTTLWDIVSKYTGRAWGSQVECLPGVHRALDLILSTTEIEDGFLVNRVPPKERLWFPIATCLVTSQDYLSFSFMEWVGKVTCRPWFRMDVLSRPCESRALWRQTSEPKWQLHTWWVADGEHSILHTNTSPGTPESKEICRQPFIWWGGWIPAEISVLRYAVKGVSTENRKPPLSVPLNQRHGQHC